MSTRSEDQQRKQRQKEFLERKENQKRIKAATKKSKHSTSTKDDDTDKAGKSAE
ncbi:hypothetical protein [uncultured Pontibacter sp.]|uniref:hypothetical protein n=1 Tax=uncultured Pontibacter sp. TaxID=453356 RepID=UPI00261D5B29|nr:hypothetical protein [uncultured Pontibacter sp.]